MRSHASLKGDIHRGPFFLLKTNHIPGYYSARARGHSPSEDANITKKNVETDSRDYSNYRPICNRKLEKFCYQNQFHDASCCHKSTSRYEIISCRTKVKFCLSKTIPLLCSFDFIKSAPPILAHLVPPFLAKSTASMDYLLDTTSQTNALRRYQVHELGVLQS